MMKKYVTYYDIESDMVLSKECLEFFYDAEEPTRFSFTPVDDPIVIYKSVVIAHPLIAIHGNEYRTKIHVTGYQQLKTGNTGKTETIITIEPMV